MKTNIIMLFIACFLSLGYKASAQTWIPIDSESSKEIMTTTLLKDDESSYQVEVNINGLLDQQIETKQGVFHRISLGTYANLQNPNEPLLPLISKLIAIPTGTTPRISVIENKWTDVEIGTILPAGFSSTSTKHDLSFDNLDKTYTHSYIPNLFAQTKEQLWRGIRNVGISICPFKYYSSEGKLSVLSKFVLKIDFIQENIQRRNNLSYEKGESIGLFDNTVFLSSNHTQNTLYNNTYLIIVGDDNLGIIGSRQLKDFMKWKAMKGFNTKVVSLRSILSTTTFSQDEVRQYIRNEVGSGGFVLLVGDYSKIPLASVSSFDRKYQTIYGDYWYGCEIGADVWEADISIGRFSVNSLGQFENMVRKTVKYEGTSPLTFNTLLIAHKEDPMSNFGYQHWCERIRNTTYPIAMNFLTAYGYEGATNADVVSLINTGVPIACYIGYGFPNYWGGLGINYEQPIPDGGWNFNGESFYSSESSNLTDTARAVIFSSASNTANISVQGNMLEAFTRNYYGSPAFVGPAIDGLNFDEYNGIYSKILFEYLFCNEDCYLADLTNKALISCVAHTGGNSVAMDYPFSFVCGGDPALELWTKSPQSFGNVGLVEGDNSITIVTSQYNDNYNVYVVGENGNLIGTYPVISGNTCTFPRPSGNFYISIYKHNFTPHIIKYDITTDAVQNEIISIDTYYHNTPIRFGDGVTADIPDGPVILKNGTKLVVQNGADGVQFIEGFKCEKGGLLKVKQIVQ